MPEKPHICRAFFIVFDIFNNKVYNVKQNKIEKEVKNNAGANAGFTDLDRRE